MTEGNFVDYVKIYVASGKGGRGSTHLHREKFIEKGGPDGGDGGRGGHVYIVGNEGLWTLFHLKFARHIKAGHGGDGGSSRSTGADGEDKIIEVPLGTVVKDKETGEVLFEITEHGEKRIVAEGGKGCLLYTSVLTLNCHIEDKGELLYNQDGTPYFKTFFFFPKEVTVIEDWKSIGLKATASHSVKLKDFRVNANRTFEINSEHPVINEPTYYYPFMSFALLTLTANHLGMQEHFMDELRKYFKGDLYNKYFEFKEEIFYTYEEKFLKRREVFYKVAKASCDEIILNGYLSAETTAEIESMCKKLVYKGRNSIMKVLPYLGMNAMNYTTEMNRIVCDILTASQFSLLLPESLE